MCLSDVCSFVFVGFIIIIKNVYYYLKRFLCGTSWIRQRACDVTACGLFPCFPVPTDEESSVSFLTETSRLGKTTYLNQPLKKKKEKKLFSSPSDFFTV